MANDKAVIEAVVCIPTFRRPAWLRRTLESLAAQESDVRFAIVVVDNDGERAEGRRVAEAFLAAGGAVGCAVVEPRQGNCRAINRAFAEALSAYRDAEFFLMIDDDEVATANWLAGMVGAARRSGADIVGGPVDRCFEGEPNPAAIGHPLFRSGIETTGFVPSLHGSGNCLIRRRVFETLDQPGFDLRFNYLGGGDMDFFTRCRVAGFKTYWNNDAVAIETVPSQRTAPVYILKRSLATGVINYTIDSKRYSGALGQAAVLAKNLATLPLGALRALRLFGKTGRWLPASHPLALSIGRNLAAFGYSPVPYKLRRETLD